MQIRFCQVQVRSGRAEVFHRHNPALMQKPFDENGSVDAGLCDRRMEGIIQRAESGTIGGACGKAKQNQCHPASRPTSG